MADVLVRPSGKLSTSAVTEQQLDDFGRDPRSMYGKCFAFIRPASDDNEDDCRDLGLGPSNELFYKVDSTYFKGHDMVKVLFEGCRVPDELSLDNLLKLIAQSELVDDKMIV
jgi:hypothetical protein